MQYSLCLIVLSSRIDSTQLQTNKLVPILFSLKYITFISLGKFVKTLVPFYSFASNKCGQKITKIFIVKLLPYQCVNK